MYNLWLKCLQWKLHCTLLMFGVSDTLMNGSKPGATTDACIVRLKKPDSEKYSVLQKLWGVLWDKLRSFLPLWGGFVAYVSWQMHLQYNRLVCELFINRTPEISYRSLFMALSYLFFPPPLSQRETHKKRKSTTVKNTNSQILLRWHFHAGWIPPSVHCCFW